MVFLSSITIFASFSSIADSLKLWSCQNASGTCLIFYDFLVFTQRPWNISDLCTCLSKISITIGWWGVRNASLHSHALFPPSLRIRLISSYRCEYLSEWTFRSQVTTIVQQSSTIHQWWHAKLMINVPLVDNKWNQLVEWS